MSDICTTECCDSSIVVSRKKIVSSFKGRDERVEFFKLLGNSSRMAILLVLSEGRMCVCDIASAIELSIPATSQQLKALKQGRILQQEKEGKTIYYSYFSTETRIKILALLLNK